MQTTLFRRNPARPSPLTIYNVVLNALDAPTADVMEQDRTFYLGVIKDALEAKYGPVEESATGAFKVGEALLSESPHDPGYPMEVVYRGKVGDKATVAYDGGRQMTVPLAWLSRPVKAPPKALEEKAARFKAGDDVKLTYRDGSKPPEVWRIWSVGNWDEDGGFRQYKLMDPDTRQKLWHNDPSTSYTLELDTPPSSVEVIEELPNAIPFGPKEIVPNDVIWIGNKSKLYVVYKTGVITLKEDALSPYTRKLMAEKGEEIPILYATALSGGDKGSIVRVFGGKLADLSGRPQTTYFEVPIFYGAPKSVKKRYDAYVKYMTDAGNESLIVPLVESNAKPVEPDAPIPESDASWWDADVRLTHSVDKGTLIEWEDGKEHEQFDAIKAIIRGRGKNFKWSRNLGSWYRPQSVGLLETRVDVGRLVDELHGLGLTVHLDLEVSDDVEAAISRKKEHLEQRADMYSERAEKLRTKAGTQADYAQQKAQEAITKMKIPGYFPTPDELAYKMATVAELQPGMEVLEPSAGHGALVDAIQRRVRSVGGGEDPTPAIVDAMEISADLRGLLKEQGIPVVSFDIMKANLYVPGGFPIGTYYDRVIMNPPFEKGQSMFHVLKAYDFVKPGGILVALMPESIMYREDKQHTRFREWLEMVDAQIFDIEPQKFGRSGEIKTRIIKVKKPRDEEHRLPRPEALTHLKEARADARISGGALQASREATRGIPMGQPILRGHHSERRHRKAVEKAERAAAKAKELADKARLAEDRARSLERTTVGAVDVTKGGRTAAAAAPKGYATGPRKKKASPFGLTGAKLKGLVGANKVQKAWGIAPYRAEWDLLWSHPDSPTTRGNTRTRLFVNIEQPGERDYFRNRNEVFEGVAFNFSVRERSISWGYRDTDKSKSVTGSIPFDTPTDEAALIIADAIVEMLSQEVLKERGEKKREALRRKLAKAKTRQNPALLY